MAQILVRDLDDGVVSALKSQAKANRRSLQGEARAILEDAVRHAERARSFRETVERRQAAWKAEGTTFSDSVDIIRELRDER